MAATDMKAQFASLHSYLYRSLMHVLMDVSDEQLAYCAPLIDQRPLREVALHAYRPVLAVACVACGEDWPPRVSLPPEKEAFLDLLGAMQAQIDALLERLPSDAAARTISLPWAAQQSVVDALNQNMGHGLLHVGSMYGIRAFGGFPLPAEEPKPPRGQIGQ